jgi:hypothetical protein
VADFVFNVALGRIAELAHRILGTGGGTQESAGAFIIALLATSGLESDATLKDLDTLAAVVAGATNEATNTGYSRLTYDETGDGLTVTVDDANDRVDVDFTDPTWAAVAADGTGAISALLVCMDFNTGAGADSDIVPLTKHDFVVTANGGSITATVPSGGFFRAS